MVAIKRVSTLTATDGRMWFITGTRFFFLYGDSISADFDFF